MLELYSGILVCKLPVHPFLFAVPVTVPLAKFFIELFQVVNSTFPKTLLRESREFYLGYVKPASVLGSVVKLKPFGKPQSLCRGKGLVEGAFVVGVEVVAHHDYLLRMGIHLASASHFIRPAQSVFVLCSNAMA